MVLPAVQAVVRVGDALCGACLDDLVKSKVCATAFCPEITACVAAASPLLPPVSSSCAQVRNNKGKGALLQGERVQVAISGGEWL